MNILFSTTADLSIYGAERNHISEVANNLATLGHRVHLVALDKGDLELHPNIRFYKMFPFINRRGLSLVTLALQRFQARWLINRVIRKEKIDVIYERQGRDFALDEGSRRGIPVVLEVNSIASEEARYRGFPPEANRSEEGATLIKFQKATKLLAISEEIANYYASRGIERNRFAVVPVGANTERFRSLDRNMCRLQLGLGYYPLVCHIGTFRPYQGLENAIKAMSLVLRALSEAKMIIVGYEGEHAELNFHPTLAELKELARQEGTENSIIFTGRVGEDELVKYVNASDVCLTLRLLTSGRNTLKLYEYLACGKPVVGSATADMAGLLQGHNCGIAVDPKNLRAVADAIVMLLRDDKLRQEMGARGRKLVEENYSWATVAKRIEGVLQETVEQSGIYRERKIRG